MSIQNHSSVSINRHTGANRALMLMLGAGAVAIVRYTGIGLAAEGVAAHGWLWDAVNGASGAGMAVLEAVGIWHAWEAWTTAQPSRNRNMLMSLIVAMFATLVTMTTPYVFSASQQARTAVTLVELAPGALWLWSLAVAAAPLLVMASAGLADTLLKTAQQGHGEAKEGQWVSQAVEGAMNALRPEFAKLSTATTQLQTQHEDVAGWVESIESRLTALQAQQNATPIALQPVALQLASGMEWHAALQHLAERNEQPTPTIMAQLTGLNKSTASRRLAKAVQS